MDSGHCQAGKPPPPQLLVRGGWARVLAGRIYGLQQFGTRSTKGPSLERVLTMMVHKTFEGPTFVLEHRKFVCRIEAMLVSEQDIEARLNVCLLL